MHPAPTTTMPRSRSYLAELDVMRGAAIVFVVYLHAYFSAWDGVPRREVFTLHAIHLFAHGAVAVFLFISGLLLARERPTTLKDFALRKFSRIYVPMLTWMAISFCYRAWREGGIDGSLIRSLLLFDISGQYYYLAVLVILTAAFYALSRTRYAESAVVPAVAFAASLATIAWYQTSTVTGDSTFAILAYRNPLVWVAFFSFGFYAGRRWRDLSWAARLLPYTIAAMALIAVAYFVLGERSTYPVSYFGVQVFLFSCCAIVSYPVAIRILAQTRAGAFAMAPLRWLSRYSFAIYLVHMPLFIGWLTEETVTGGRFADDYMQLMTALFVVGFAGSLAFVLVAERLSAWFAATFMGVEARQPRPRAPEVSTP